MVYVYFSTHACMRAHSRTGTQRSLLAVAAVNVHFSLLKELSFFCKNITERHTCRKLVQWYMYTSAHMHARACTHTEVTVGSRSSDCSLLAVGSNDFSLLAVGSSDFSLLPVGSNDFSLLAVGSSDFSLLAVGSNDFSLLAVGSSDFSLLAVRFYHCQ